MGPGRVPALQAGKQKRASGVMMGRGRTAARMVEPLLWIAVASAVCALYAGAAWFSDLNQDEGWYLYAGSMVARGKLPFLDFASTQGPLMSLVYGAAHGLVARGGVLGGRLFTGALGLLAAGLASALAGRLVQGPHNRVSRRYAALVTLALCGLSLYEVTFTTTVKTYALTAVFMLLGFHALLPVGAGRWGLWRGLCAGFLLAAATATRSSAFAVMPVVGVWLLFGACRGQGCRDARHRLGGFVVGGALGGLLFLGPFVLHAWPAVEFGLIRYHAGRVGGEGLAVLVYKAGFLLRLTGHYLPAMVGVLVLLLMGLLRPMPSLSGRGNLTLLWASIAALTLLHLAAPFPYDDYQVIAYPLLCVVVGVGLVGCCGTGEADAVPGRLRALVVLVALAVLLHGVCGPILQGWFIGPRDRIWWPLKRETPLQGLRRVARELRADGAQRGDLLLTQDAYVAVEAGMRLPAGLEMGPFSIFPGLSDLEAQQQHVVNVGMLRDLLERAEPQFAAFSGYGLAISCPSVTELPIDEREQLWEPVEMHYRELRREKGFGQAYTTLRLMRKRGMREEAK